MRRTKLEIINDLLLAIQERGGTIRPTHLMYRGNLSNKLLHEYIEELSQKGMIEKTETGTGFVVKLLDQGYKFLEQYKKMKEFQETFGL